MVVKGASARLADLTMKRALLHEMIELDLLETAGRANAFFVPSGDITRRRQTSSSGFRAFKGNNIAGHKRVGRVI